MKIAYITQSSLPAETANTVNIVKMCQSFADNGHEIALLFPYKHQQQDDIYDFYNVKQNFTLKKIPWISCKGQGYIYGGLCALWSKVKKTELIYTRYLYGAVAGTFLKIPTIYEIHTPTPSIDENLLVWLLKQKMLKKIVVISLPLKQYYEKTYNIPPNKIIVAHDGADEQPTTPSKKIFVGNSLHVGYIGHLYKGKGMEIIENISSECPWAIFHIVGGTKKDIEFWKNKTKNKTNIIFHGFSPQRRLIEYRNSCDVLIAPYQKEVAPYGGNINIAQWMSPLKIFEYMAAGKPILSSRLPTIQEILTHQKTALLCDPDTISDWATALKTLKDDKDLRSRLGANAKNEFIQKYTWKKRGQKIIKNIEESC